jgi:hypothetical protein
MSKLIPLTQGYYTLVSDEDYDWLNQYKWQFANGYACNPRLGFMSRAIMQPSGNPYFVQVDHINRIKNDNRRGNLRIVSSSENRKNQSRLQRNPWSSFKEQLLREGHPNPDLVPSHRWSAHEQEQFNALKKEIEARQRVANLDMLLQLMLSDAEQRQFSNY